MQVMRVTVAGAPAIVSRTGYTDEDGFEISLEGADAGMAVMDYLPPSTVDKWIKEKVLLDASA